MLCPSASWLIFLLLSPLAERSKAPVADPAEIKRRNQEALAKRKAELAKKKEEEKTRPLPDGWRRVESRSRPGEFVYENINTEERQGWFPDAPAKEEGALSGLASIRAAKRKPIFSHLCTCHPISAFPVAQAHTHTPFLPFLTAASPQLVSQNISQDKKEELKRKNLEALKKRKAEQAAQR